MFTTLDIIFEYCIKHTDFGPLYVTFRFSMRIFYSGVPGFATDCPCGVWCHGLTTCLLYVVPFLRNLAWNDSIFVSLTYWRHFETLHLQLQLQLVCDVIAECKCNCWRAQMGFANCTVSVRCLHGHKALVVWWPHPNVTLHLDKLIKSDDF